MYTLLLFIIYILGCAGSSLLTRAFSICREWGLLSNCEAFSFCRAEALGAWASAVTAHRL